MPYIKKENGRREALQKDGVALSAGELNYKIYYYVKHYDYRTYYTFKNKIRRFVIDFLGEKPNYQKYNDMTGCLVRCQKEIYRRLNIDLESFFYDLLEEWDYEIASYEDKKIKKNGDVE